MLAIAAKGLESACDFFFKSFVCNVQPPCSTENLFKEHEGTAEFARAPVKLRSRDVFVLLLMSTAGPQ